VNALAVVLLPLALVEYLMSPELFTVISEESIFVKGDWVNDNSNVAPGVPFPLI
jgi:hypothetical protein